MRPPTDTRSAARRRATPAFTRRCTWTPGPNPPPALRAPRGPTLTSLRFLHGPHGALLLGPVGSHKPLSPPCGRIAYAAGFPHPDVDGDAMCKRLNASCPHLSRLSWHPWVLDHDSAPAANGDIYRRSRMSAARPRTSARLSAPWSTPMRWLAIAAENANRLRASTSAGSSQMVLNPARR